VKRNARPGGGSLARQYAVPLVLVFCLFELVSAASVVVLLMAPMARRSAEDLVGLMVLSAQTWTELPPETRPAFEQELIEQHQLALRADSPGPAPDEWHMPYLYLLEAALAARTGVVQHLARERIAGEDWYWASLPAGSGHLSVGFPHRRIGAQPFVALAFSLLAGVLLSIVLGLWLARRMAAPLARLQDAADRVGQGGTPEALPESGPREVAQLARHFNLMAGQVKALLAARTTLLAGVSHDIRTPLARMRLAIEILRENPASAALDRLEIDIEEINQLVASLLELARGLDDEDATEIDLAHLLGELAADHPDVGVCCGVDQLRAAPLALRRALGNLLGNALRYGAGQPIELRAEAARGACRIGVLDRGPGIAADQLDAVRQPFYRIEPSRSGSTGGAGLGLAIVQQLAQLHGWQLELGARPGGGLAAWLNIPTARR
jgi:two-component system, OmpR family, osmolarity sensor histidine kinase EnvZ